MESVTAMKSIALDAVSEVWQATGCPVRIACSRALMEELALASSAGFNRLAKGGVEIGGVLFGVRDSDSVKILTYRALACEYAFGPSFTLSGSDRRALEDLLSSPNTDSNLSGMLPVGWYHSHTRSPILLSGEDLQLFQQYFPETWQIALVLRPHRFDPVRAGFFFRESDGSVQAARSQHEFVIKPLADKPGSLPDDPPGPPLVEPGSLEPPAISMPRSDHSSTSWTASTSPQAWWSWRAATVVLTLAVALFCLDRFRAAAGLTLHQLDVAGHLRIDWNHNARIIRQAESGAIEIEDGSFKLHHELSPEYLRLGSATYLRTTGNVLVRLLVRRADQSTFTEFARFQGSSMPVATPVDTPPAEKDRTPPPPISPELEQQVRSVPGVNHPSQESPREAPPASAASTLPRRQLTLPPAGTPHPAEPLLPAPPAIAPNTPAPAATYVPHLPITAPPKPDDQSPSAGKIIWTGKLARGATVQILGNRASPGRVTGGLPGVPVRVQVFPSELVQEGLRIFTADPASIAPPEAPGAQNGWNRTIYVLNPRKAGEIVIPEAPAPQNAWNRIVLRAERGDHSIIVLRWERVAAEPSLHSRSNP